mgnify:CR=1 FL=1
MDVTDPNDYDDDQDDYADDIEEEYEEEVFQEQTEQNEEPPVVNIVLGKPAERKHGKLYISNFKIPIVFKSTKNGWVSVSNYPGLSRIYK